jgi:hypothetical protein
VSRPGILFGAGASPTAPVVLCTAVALAGDPEAPPGNSAPACAMVYERRLRAANGTVDR